MTPETNRNEKHPIQLEPFKNFNPSNNHTQLQHQQQLVGNYQDCIPIDPVINNSSKPISQETPARTDLLASKPEQSLSEGSEPTTSVRPSKSKWN
ncbi:hypothetical protein BY996DRAFT_6519030 [Phakopsora pachyrhizi]|nr:hypothetical protein BY996DRAFT_6519030 [Phakopsora pachyrhizi]